MRMLGLNESIGMKTNTSALGLYDHVVRKINFWQRHLTLKWMVKEREGNQSVLEKFKLADERWNY